MPEKEEVEMADRKPTLGISRSQHFERGGFANMLEAPKESSPQDPDFAFERNDNEPEDSFRALNKSSIAQMGGEKSTAPSTIKRNKRPNLYENE